MAKVELTKSAVDAAQPVELRGTLAQEWLAEVRRGGDPGAAKTAAQSPKFCCECPATYAG